MLGSLPKKAHTHLFLGYHCSMLRQLFCKIRRVYNVYSQFSGSTPHKLGENADGGVG
mgnify:CR=1 FL=1